MGLRNYIIGKLAVWLEPVIDRIFENKNASSVKAVKEAFIELDESDKKKLKAYNDYVSTRNKKKLDADISNMMRWEVSRQEIQGLKHPKANKVKRSTTSGSGRLNVN